MVRWINHRVVLVLGAGASEPYGFPLGRQLVEDRAAGNLGGSLQNVVIALRPEEELVSFQTALRQSRVASIDAFLERRPQFEAVGKVVLGALLLEAEQTSALHAYQRKGRWYDYLFERMSPLRFEDFRRNQLSVVTFNYDRSLETFLLDALANTYGRSREECWETLSETVPIVHVHGQLGKVVGEDFLPYGLPVTQDTVRVAARSITIVHEAEAKGEAFETARALIRQAEVVLFLGFRFHPQNVERLDFPRCLSEETMLAGTSYGLTRNEVEADVIPLFSGKRRPKLSGPQIDVLGFLRNNVTFLRKG